MAFLGAILLLLTIVLGVVNTTVAQASFEIRINEIMWDGIEYVELFNESKDEIILSGWYLTRQGTENESEEIIVNFEEVHKIPAGGYFLITKNDLAVSLTPDVVDSGLVLRNDGELLRLYTAADELVDSANQFGMWYAGQNTGTGVSMERSSTDGLDGMSWHTSFGNSGGRFGTPGAENSTQGAPSSTPAVISSTTPTPVITEIPTVTPITTPAPYSREVYISEFLPNPIGSDAALEFIEIVNGGGNVVDLTGWSLDDADGGSSPWEFPANTLIESGEILAWYRPEIGISLNNDSDQVRLLDPDEEIVVEAIYSGNILEGVAFIRSMAGTFIQTITPTPGEDNVLATPSPSSSSTDDEDITEEEYQLSDKIVINEFLVNPMGSDTEEEYIEIRNEGSESVSLTGWQLDDDEDGSKPYTIPDDTSIESEEIIVFKRSDTGISLNNSNDSARILDPWGKIVSKAEYEEAVPEAFSHNRLENGEYALSSTQTPGKPNVITSIASEINGMGGDTKMVKLSDIRSEEIGTVITTEGVVSVPPELLGKGVMYIAGSGIQIYSSKIALPSLNVGDKIQVTGEYGTLNGEARVKISDASGVILVDKGASPEPHIMNTGDVQEGTEGSLVKIEGEVVRSAGSTFYVDDGTGEIRIVVKSTTSIEKPSTRQGTRVSIIGIVSETQSGYRILPRFQGDIQILSAVAGTKDVASSSKKTIQSVADSLKVTSSNTVAAFTSEEELDRTQGESVRPSNVGRLPRFIVMTTAAILAALYVINGLGYEEPLLSFLHGSQ